MKITITPTPRIISLSELDRHNFPRMIRAWEGITENGIKCTVLVSGVAVPLTSEQASFEQDLREFIPNDQQFFFLSEFL